MKDYKIENLDYRTVENLIFNNKYDLAVTICQGALVDNYFIDDWGLGIKKSLGRNVRPRKHLYAIETYINEWSSGLTLVLTDSDEEYYTVKRDFIGGYLQENKKEKFLDKNEKLNLKEELQECIRQLAN